MFAKKEKIECICEYIQGKNPSIIMKKHGVKGSATIYEWFRIFKVFGPEGFDVNKTKTVCSYSFKIRVIIWRTDHHASYPIAAKKFRIRFPCIIWQWERQLIQGQLKPENREMTKTPSNKNDKDLEKENRYLSARVAYLEKLQVLVQKKKQFQMK